MATGIYIRKKKDPYLLFIKKVRVNPLNNCWEWKGYKGKKGYGIFTYSNGTLAHRFSYLHHKGEIPKDMQVCHHCDNTACVNPEHLWLGTNRDNQIDCIKKGRAYRNSPKGSKNGLSKLLESDVRKIKQMKINKIPEKDIAKQFHISISNVYYITSGRTWKHVS